MKLLILGSSGQVGREVCAFANRLGIEFRGLSTTELDLTREGRVWWAVRRAKPSIVINAAAFTAVDDAESQPDRCMAVNREGVYYLAKSCRRFNVPVLHISTDYVFDGKKPSPYIESDATAPANVYGDSKLQGEHILADTLSDHIIVRVSWVFSEWRKNFVKSMVNLCQEKESLRIVKDQCGCPTPAADIARVLIGISQQLDTGAEAWGTYHYCGREETNWYQFCKEVISETQKYRKIATQEVTGIRTSEYDYLAQRPLNSVLNCQKILDTFGIQQRSWKPELSRVVERCCEA